MQKILPLIVSFFLFSTFAKAQITDNFSDGNFTANPIWSGDAAEFIVNTSFQLQTNNTLADSSYLSTQSFATSLNNTEWSFYIKQSFSPSGNNYGRVYLSSDQANLQSTTLNGYYLQFGEALSNDAVELFRQTGTTSTSVCRGTNGQIANSFSIGVRVTRDAAGFWSLYIDPLGGTAYGLETTGTDNTYTTTSYFGISTVYTVSNANNFYFDNFYNGAIIVDVTPPNIISSTVISSTQVDVLFDEAVDLTTSQTITNYSANNLLSNPTTVVRDAVNFSIVHLTFVTPFANGLLNTLTIINVQDLAANVIVTATTNFTYIIVVPPSFKDIIINEIMADPTPQVNVPAVEFIEIYNRSANTFNLNGWKFTDNVSTATLGNFVLSPNQYLIISNTADTALFISYGNHIGVSSFPSLNNSGDHIYLKNDSLVIIDSVIYSDTWYQDAVKKNGGWTLELINPNPNASCPASSNWIASNNVNGGTPGIINSVYSTTPDTTHPTITSVTVIDLTHINVCFSKPLDASSLSIPANYSINNGIGIPIADSINTLFTCAYLTLSTPLSYSTVYTITIINMTDCIGNTLRNNTTTFVAPEQAMPNDIVINEILSDPTSSGTDFVEIYNRSNKIIDLKTITLSEFDTINNIITSPKVITTVGYLMYPNDYVLLSANGNSVKSEFNTTNPNGFINLPSMIAMNIASATVCLSTSTNIIDNFTYNVDMQFALLNVTKGVSLERIDFNRPTQDRTNWHSAAEDIGFGTPAYKNSQYNEAGQTDNTIEITPEIFSPDNDGYNDIVNINYHFDIPGFVANVTIYDSKGRLVKLLIQNELLGTKGTFSWDGINDGREKCRIGIYIIYFEVFDLTGTVKHYKKTCVLAGKL